MGFRGAPVFRGVTPLNLDAKGRMAMPARYRERLEKSCGGQLILTLNQEDRCLWLYPLPEWEEIERKLTELSSFDRHTMRLKRLLIGHASECDLDSAGRILMPVVLRQLAGIERSLVLLGQGNKFEVWDAASYERKVSDWLSEDLGEASEAVKSLSL
ncbi:DNA-binding transcriptional repressor MraZ [Gammaproteobacteria bacterium]